MAASKLAGFHSLTPGRFCPLADNDCGSRRKEAPADAGESEKVGERESGQNAPAAVPPAHSPAFPPAASPREVTRILDRVAKLRILDPACGSGSFLIGAYQFLLDWHLQFYLANDPSKFARGNRPALVQTGKGWKLTIAERKRILLANIFGVDIDAQAVEVTKLSLLLKVLEGETGQTLQTIFRLFSERALPDLGDNIKCGNSLIGPDFYQQAELPLLTDEERYRINVFDWRAEFADIFKAGGFDAVIGNPPYVLQQTLDQRPVFDFFSAKFQTAKYKIDTYHLFLEKGLKLTARGGKLGYITPNTFLRNKHARELRNFVLSNANVDILRVFYYPVFRGASVDTSVVISTKTQKPNRKHCIQVIRSNELGEPIKQVEQVQSRWMDHPTQDFSLPGSAGSDDVVAKILGRSCLLGDFATAYFGIQTFDRDKFVAPKRAAKHFKPALDGTNIQRYALLPSVEFVDFRPDAIKSGGKQTVYEQERVGVRQIGEVPVAALLPAGLYSLNTIYNIFFVKPTGYSLRFVLGIICSKALGWYWRHTFFDNKETFPKVKKDALLSIPVPQVIFSEKADQARHDRMVKLVEQMLELHRQLAAARTPQEQTALERQIAATDAQIDRLVYDLYGLSEDEIKIVEGRADDAPASETAERPAPEAQPKRTRKKPLYALPPPAPADASHTPDSEPAVAVFHNVMGKEEPTPYRVKGDEP